MFRPRLWFFSILCFLMVLSQMETYAQGSSNKGTDFWLGYGNHVSTGNMVLYLTSDVNTTATVTIPNLNFSQTVAITANVVQFVDIPTAAHLTTDGKSLNGIHLTSLKPIIAYAHIYQNSVSGATLVLPVNTLGKDYYSINYKQISNQNNCSSWFFIVAVEDDTKVEITPTQTTLGGWAANSVNVVSLKKGEIYNVMGTFTNAGGSSSGVDLTGSKIKSISTNGTCKKIAVFSGSSKIAINCLTYTLPTSGSPNPGSADNLFQQVYPTSTWGKSFITVPQLDRDFVIYRILKSDPAAVVILNGNIIPAANFVNNFYYEFASKQIDVISSTKPIQTVQYGVTQGKSLSCGTVTGDVGDPEMIFLNPVEQTLNQITMYSTPRNIITKHFINVVIKKEGVPTFKLDGINIASSFANVPNSTTHSYAQLRVAVGTHNLVSDFGFNATAYGFGSADSYGYAAGANLTNYGVESVDDASSQIIQTVCANTPFSLKLKLPYPPVDIYLDKDGTGLKALPLPLELLSQTTKDGETTYVYSLIKSLLLNTPGTYPFKVKSIKPTTDDCGTGDEFNFDLTVNSKPVANFTAPTRLCLNDVSSFVYVADPTEPAISNYLWDFNGEGTSALKDPAFTFLTSGIKKVRFSTKSTSACWSDVVEKTVEVFALPTPNFVTSTPACDTKDIQFTDQSTTIGQTITKWQWDFDDPTSTSNSSTIQNPTHTFNNAKTYNVTLTVTTDLGCVKVLIKQVIINPQPKVDFETPEICLDDALATFTNKTTIQGNTALTYLWDFGDTRPGSVNTSTLINPSHKYIKAAVYLVKLKVKSLQGCEIEIIKTFTVNGSTPKALFNIQNENSLCVNQPVIFKDTSTIDFGEITKIEWYYDDARPTIAVVDNNPNLRTDPAKNYAHTYPIFYSPAERKVNVRMLAYSGNSATCISTITKTLILKAAPIANFILPQDGCLTNGDAQFTDASTFLGLKTGFTYSWNFGDSISGLANTSNLENPIHKFQSAKNYTISLIVTAPNGCSAIITKAFIVKGAIAEPLFTVLNKNNLCSSNEVIFTDIAKISFGEITKIEWNFDADNQPNNPLYQLIDNNPATRTEVSKSYPFLYPVFSSPLTKTIKVKMKVFSGIDCVNEITETIILKATPKVVFNDMIPVCEEVSPYQIIEAKETTGFVGKGVFSGKGVSNTGLFSPAVAGVGTHTITFTFKGDNGCTDQITKDIMVYPTPIANAGTDETILIGGSLKLNATASGNNVSYNWSPSTGLDNDKILNPTASPLEDTEYVLTVTSENGCEIMDEVFIKVLKYPEIPNTFTPNGDGVNDTWEIKHLGSYPNSTIIIFNRYGNDVYKSNSYTAWDGKLNGVSLPDGMYYYIVTAFFGQLKYTGSVMIKN